MGRIASLDITKGFCIILMTMTHIGLANLAPLAEINQKWFFLFKMPGFYIISGYLMFKSIGSSGFILRKIDGIYKPCFAIIGIMMLLGLAKSYYVDNPQPLNFQIFFPFIEEHYRIPGLDVKIPAAWFVLNLSICFAFCKGLHWSWTQRHYYFFAALITILILINLAPELWNLTLPLKLNHCIFGVLYLFTGYFLRAFNLDLRATINLICGGLVFIVLRLAIPTDVLMLDFYNDVFGDFFVTYIASVTGVLALVALFSHVPETSLVARFLTLCSQNSLFILLLHVPVYVWINTTFQVYFNFSKPLNLLWAHILTIVLCLLISLLFKGMDRYGYLFKARPKQKAATS